MERLFQQMGDGGRFDEFLNDLFPFHLTLQLDTTPTIFRAASTLERWLGCDFADRPFADCFDILRPAISALDGPTLLAKRDTVFVIEAKGHFAQLRGQIVVLGSERAIFIGSPVLTTTTRVEELGLSLADFAPHDVTVDLIVLQRFAEMQLADLKEQAAELDEAQAATARLSESAATDPLTGLANRRAFWSRCGAEIDNQRELALLFIDVDRFKAVNDVHGHGVGDAVLRSIGSRLTETVRPDDLVARLGGDEFAVLLADADQRTTASIVGRIQDAVGKPIDIDGHICESSISIGVVSRTANETVDELVQDADAAMYEGRQHGPGRITWFADRMRVEREERRALTEHLEQAVDRGSVGTVFQPILRLDDRSMATCEALARWDHPERGPIAPATFIELAERAALIERLDDLMLSRSLENLLDWQKLSPTIGVQVNVSGRSIGPSLAGRIAGALDRTGVNAASLTIELTESWLMQNEAEVAAALNEIADLGVRIHLDDFGTGYSSLAHIHELPISGLKIDRSFVGQALVSERSRRLIAATIGMAHSLELEVIAEGVEDEETARLLRELGCNYGQGFLFARPGTGRDVVAILESELVRPAHR